MDAKAFIKKIRNDKLFYMHNFLKIRTKSGELITFKVNNAQRKSMERIAEQKKKGKPVRVIWLKARQLGISTFCEGYIFHDTANSGLKNSMIIAHEDKATQNLFAMSKLFYEELPDAIRPMKKYSNESALTFENPTNDDAEKKRNPGLRSKITVATAKNVDTGRSATIHNLHASEVAFWDNAERLMTGLLQCVPDTPNSSVFIESTANGIGGWFYNLWKRSERGETDYIPIFLAWFDNPEYIREFDTKSEKKAFVERVNSEKGEEYNLIEQFGLTWEQLNWRKWCISNKLNNDIELFHQEYPSTPDEAFIASGRPEFSIEALKEYRNKELPPISKGYLERTREGLKWIEDNKGYINVWKKPVPGMFYVAGVDVAEGLAIGDYSCMVLLDESLDIAASWHGHIDPDLLGYEVVKLAQYYNDAYVGVESNNHGLTTLRCIQRQEYWNIYYQKSYDKIADKISQKVGWNTNRRTKPLLVDALKQYIREKWLGMHWDTLIGECFTFVKHDDGSVGAQDGEHDDTVIATGIALQLFLEGRGSEYAPEIPFDSLTKRDKIYERYSAEETAVDNSEKEEYSI